MTIAEQMNKVTKEIARLEKKLDKLKTKENILGWKLQAEFERKRGIR